MGGGRGTSNLCSTKTHMQVQTAFLQLQGEEISLNPLAVQQQTVLFQSFEVNGNVVMQSAGSLFWIHVDHRVIPIVLKHVGI